jgi:hypothetical protein
LEEHALSERIIQNTFYETILGRYSTIKPSVCYQQGISSVAATLCLLKNTAITLPWLFLMLHKFYKRTLLGQKIWLG